MDDLPNLGTNLPVPNQPIADPPPADLAPTNGAPGLHTTNQIPLAGSSQPSFAAPWERTPAPTPVPIATTNGFQATTAAASNNVVPPPPVGASTTRPNPLGGLKGRNLKPYLVGSLVLILLIVAAGAGLKFLVIDRVTTFDLLPDNTRFYLQLAVKNNPQAKAFKDLIKKFPNGDKVVTSFDKQITDSLSTSDDPFEDFLRLDKTNLFITQISKPDSKATTTIGSNNIISISDMLNPAAATDKLAKFEKNEDNKVTKSDYNGQTIYEIYLKDAQGSAQPATRITCYPPSTGTRSTYQQDYCPTTKTKTTPPTIFSTAIKQFIVAGPKKEDIQKISDLDKVKASLGLKNDKKLKSLAADPSHQAIARYFPKDAFLKYYSNTPISPYNSFLPASGISQSFLGITSYGLTSPSDDSSSVSENLVNGLAIATNKSGLEIKSLQLDNTKTKNKDAQNPFNFTDSLANQIPAKLNGVAPAFYAETRNMKQIIQDQIDQITDLSENSDSRKQRDSFKQALKNWDQTKSDFKKSTNLDFDKDLLPLFEGQSAIIFNAGGAKISPEVLILTEVKDQTNAENSLKKIKIPDYSVIMRDQTRKYDLQDISSALRSYYLDNKVYPDNLSTLAAAETRYGSPYLYSGLPTDPTTGQNYSYTPGSDKKSYTLKANLEDGRVATITNASYNVTYTGTADPAKTALLPKPTDYSGTKIYSIQIYSYGDIKLSFYFAVTKKKAILAWGTTDTSIKEIIDFESKGGSSLFKSSKWQEQFGSTKEKVAGFAYVEPIAFWGLVDWAKSIDSSYTSYFDSNMETAYKAYLETLSSIGTLVTKKKPVFITDTNVMIKELPSDKKKAAEEAIDHLINQDEINNYDTVLGVSTHVGDNFGDQIYHYLKGKFLP